MKNLLIAIFLTMMLVQVQAQIAINSTGQNADASAMLDVQSTDKGLLVPRMTMVQRDGIASPATGLLVFQIDETIGYYYYNGVSWTSLGGAGGAGIPSTGIIMSDTENSQSIIDEGFTYVGKQLNRIGEYGEIPVGWSKTTEFYENDIVKGVGSSVTATDNEVVFLGGYYLDGSDFYAVDFGLVYDCSGLFKEIKMPYVSTPGNTAVWSGSDILVYGGYDEFDTTYPHTGPGYIYNVESNSWTAMSTADAPSPRYDAFSVWTGTEMIVWGGKGLDENNSSILHTDGARYNPITDTWTAMASNTNIVQNNIKYSPIWTGTEMMLVSINNDSYRYNPTTDTWTAMSTTGAPSAPRYGAAVAWTGSELIVYGGYHYSDPTSVSNGGRYDPATDTWQAMPSGGPIFTTVYNAVWNGSEMLVSGRFFDSGWNHIHTFFNPLTDTWTPIAVDPGKEVTTPWIHFINDRYYYFNGTNNGVGISDIYTPAGVTGYNFSQKAHYLYKKN